MFSLRRPSEERVAAFLAEQRDAPLSYGEVGASRGAPETVPGHVVDRNRARLGEGEETFDRAVDALLAWKMFGVGWARIVPSGARAEVGTTVAVLARHHGFWSLNASRVVYALDEDDGAVLRRGFAYGTLTGHAESGEERFVVEHRRSDNAVFYDLYAFSRPNHPLAKLGRPLARNLQRRFARDSLRAMTRTV